MHQIEKPIVNDQWFLSSHNFIYYLIEKKFLRLILCLEGRILGYFLFSSASFNHHFGSAVDQVVIEIEQQIRFWVQFLYFFL
jgi:hypothetical protein